MIRQYKQLIKKKYIKSVINQLKSGDIGLGSKTEEFESKICNRGKHIFAVLSASGSLSYILALLSLRLPPKSTILFPAYTFLAGIQAATFLGFNVRLVDVNEGTLCMDPNQIRINRDVSAIIFVNHNGYVGKDIAKVAQICRDARIKLIEDASQAIGIYGAGRSGDVGIYSFSTGNLISTGQGGCLVTDSYEIASFARQIRLNVKFNDILASFGVAQIDDIDNLLIQRKKIFDIYRKYLPIVDFGLASTAMVVYRTLKKDANTIIKHLLENQIEARSLYSPVNLATPYNDGKIYPGASNLYNRLVYLPSSLDLSKKDIKKICSIVLKADGI